MLPIIAQISDVLQDAQRLAILTHVMPDGDCLGSGLGLAWALRGRGYQATVYCPDALPDEYRFIPGSEDLIGGPQASVAQPVDVILIVDCSDMDRVKHLYDAALFGSVPVVNIDHHRTNTHYADLNLVLDRAATAEIILELLQALDLPLDQRIATCLLTGLITDTRGFRTSSTTADTFRAATTLTEAGASLGTVMDAVYNHRSTNLLRLWAQALSAHKLEDGLLWTSVTQEMLASVEHDVQATSGLANFLSTFHEAQVALVLTELPDGIDVSMRSTPAVDVSQVALSLGGGGHKQAAGCQLKEPLAEAEARVVAAIRRAQAAAPAADPAVEE